MSRNFSYIRFSTTSQLSGDSHRRQLDGQRAWCAARGEMLDERTYKDLGVSAFYGKNAKDGDLGLFLQAIKTGQIEPGDKLLIESFDRLSRDKPFKVLMGPFGAIIMAGVWIVTTQDNKIYNLDNIDELGTIFTGWMGMTLAHTDNKDKAKRIKEAWDTKRDNAATQIMTRSAPAWMKVIDGTFVLIPARAIIVKEIFRLATNGYGKRLIAKEFNTKEVPLFSSKGDGWRQSYIKKILHNRAVIGEYRPHLKQPDGKRIPTAINLEGYYPRVVTDDEFDIAQIAVKGRTGKGGGPNKTDQNIFTGLLKCGYCGGSMHRHNRGDNDIVLRCDRAYRGMGCEHTKLYSYLVVESTLLFHIHSLDIEKLLSNKEEDNSLNIIRLAIDALNAQRDNIKAAILEGGDMRTLVLMLKDVEVEIQTAEDKLKDALRSSKVPVRENWDMIDELIERMEEPGFRIVLRDRIRQLVTAVVLREETMEVQYRYSTETDRIEYME